MILYLQDLSIRRWAQWVLRWRTEGDREMVMQENLVTVDELALQLS